MSDANGREVGLPLPVESTVRPSSKLVATFTRNSMLSVGRVLATAALALILPGYLTHKLSVTVYAAWVLIMQVSTYVAYLEFGIQSGVSKYVAEYSARGDAAGSSKRASAGLALMVVAGTLGVFLTLILACLVPEIFREMPATLDRDVRISIIFVGVSLSFGLICSVFSSIFLGLQRYAVPMILSLFNRVLYTAVVLAAVALDQSLAVMGALVAAVNVVAGFMQFEAWRRWANSVRLNLSELDPAVVKQMFSYCFSLAIWTAGMLCVSGLDITIVGRYDYAQTSFYSIAVLPTNFMSAIVGAALSPLMPAASALSVHRSPVEMGGILSRVMRYALIMLLVTGLPLLVGGYWILRAWVGPAYAASTVGYLRMLILANILRNICMPYASMLVATESQRIAIGGVIAEAIVNVSCSVYLARHIGAIGVAYGTLLGAIVSVAMHFTINMHYTKAKFAISRVRLFLSGVVRPSLIAIPSILLIPYWWSNSAPSARPPIWIVWGLCTILLAWFVGLNRNDRETLGKFVARR